MSKIEIFMIKKMLICQIIIVALNTHGFELSPVAKEIQRNLTITDRIDPIPTGNEFSYAIGLWPENDREAYELWLEEHSLPPLEKRFTPSPPKVRPSSLYITLELPTEKRAQEIGLDLIIASIQHEMQHRLLGDNEIDYAAAFIPTEYRDIVEALSFKNDMEIIARYTDIGKSTFKGKSIADRYLYSRRQEKINAHEPFKDIIDIRRASTIPFTDEDEEWSFYRPLYKRGRERRADLHALEELYKNNNLDAILAQIYEYAPMTIAAEDKPTHPSDFERALYFMGFLKDHGHDVSSMLAKYEKEKLSPYLKQKKEYMRQWLEHNNKNHN